MRHHLFRQARNEGKRRAAGASRARGSSAFFDVVEELSVFVQHLGTIEFPRLVVLRNAQVLPPVVTPSKSILAEAPETKVRNYWRGVTTVRWKSSRGNTATEVSSMFHNAIPAQFVLDSKPFAPGPRPPSRSAPSEVTRCSCGRKGQALSDIFSSMSS